MCNYAIMRPIPVNMTRSAPGLPPVCIFRVSVLLDLGTESGLMDQVSGAGIGTGACFLALRSKVYFKVMMNDSKRYIPAHYLRWEIRSKVQHLGS